MTVVTPSLADAALEFRREREEAARRSTPLTRAPPSATPTVTPPEYAPAYMRGLKVLNAEELLKANFPPRSLMLAPWLPDKGLSMIFAPR
jgi:hypothetical protein